MTLRTLGKYLFLLDRQAIRDIAGCRQAVWLGLVFVISAGFAREYDGEYLLAEPWHLLLPLGASLATSFLLFGFVWLMDRGWKREQLPFKESYRSFLGLYWLTAPLAWLYAIPVEHFLSPADAVRANLWLLAIVAAWRVVLMIQVVRALFRISVVRALFPVFLFADSLMVVILFLTPLPVLLWGGIRLSESEKLIQETAFLVVTFGILSAPIWLIGSLIVAAKRLPADSADAPTIAHRESISQSTWGLGIASLFVFLLILPTTQPEQRLRHEAEVLMRDGKTSEALELMSAHDRGDFPPHWDPPPRIGYREKTPDMLIVMEALIQIDVKPWVAEIYWEKFLVHHGRRGSRRWHHFWQDLVDDKKLIRHLAILEDLPENDGFLEDVRHQLKFHFFEHSESLTDPQRDGIRNFLGDELKEPPIENDE